MTKQSASSLMLPVLALAFAGHALSQTTWSGSGPDRDWNNPANWTGDVAPPDGTVKANIWNSPGPVVNAATATVKELDVRTVVDIEAGGILATSGWFIIGHSLGESGTLNIKGGATTVGTHIDFGLSGTGSGVMTAGSLWTDNLFIGWNATGVGHFTLSGAGARVTADDVRLGNDGKATVVMTAGTLSINRDLILGNNGTGNGEMTVSGGTVENFDDLYIGNNGTGKLTMNGPVGGTITSKTSGTRDLVVGREPGSDGKLYMASGSISMQSIAYVGLNGAGLLDMTGGSITAGGPLVIGRNTGSSGEVLLKGGTITAGSLEFNNEGASLLSRMDITAGTLILAGDREGLVNGYIGAGYLTGYGSADSLNVVYAPGTDRTTVTAVPPVSSLPLTIKPNSPDSRFKLEWNSQAGMRYRVLSNTGLGTPVDSWSIIAADIAATPPGNSYDVDPTDPALFYAVEEYPGPPVEVFAENFDGATPGSLPTDWSTGTNPADNSSLTSWELGTPANVGPIPPGVALPSGSHCVATNISGNYDDPVSDLGVAHTDIWLRTPSIDLGAATQGTLKFQQWTEIEVDLGDLDYGSIRILDASDDSELAVIENQSIDGSTSGWEEYSMALPAAAFTATDGTIKVEWRFEADDLFSFAGWYIDDVAVTTPGS